MTEAEKGFRVTVEDLATGEKNSVNVPIDDYLLVATGSCYIAHINDYPTKGTRVLTIKGRRP